MLFSQIQATLLINQLSYYRNVLFPNIPTLQVLLASMVLTMKVNFKIYQLKEVNTPLLLVLVKLDIKLLVDIQYDPYKVESTYNALPSPGNMTKQAYVILDGYVLDVTSYLIGVTTIIPLSATLSSRSFAMDRMFLPLDLTLFLYINLGKDITDTFSGNVTNSEFYRKCLVHLFQKGVAPSHTLSDCRRINPALWATMGAGLLYFLIKMNLAYLSRVSLIQRLLFSSAPPESNFYYQQQRQSSSPLWPHTILMIPCFAESSETLKQTLDSLSRSTYDDTKKLLLFICDGITTNAREQKQTHTVLLEYLGYSCTEEPLPQPYTSLGQHSKRINFARVYSGFYETGRNRVPYMVIVKIGQPQEEANYYANHMATAPAGNRGKRDSLVLVLSFLERCMNLANHRITPLEYEMFNQCYNVLGIDPRLFKYMMVTDADIQVQADVVQKLVSRLERDRTMLAISGHVRPANPEENLTTMLQIFPLYMTFYSGLAYEACLRSVMTINGGLVMYKIWTENVPQLQQQEDKFIKKWKLLQKHGNHTKTPPVQQQYKWPKLSDEIIVTNPFQDPASTHSRQSSYTNESITTMTTTTTASGALQRSHTRSTSDGTSTHASRTTRPESRLSLSARVDIRPCCVHPTVLRGLAKPQANTMHMQNVLLLGEEKLMPLVLLRSHPNHRLGFEPEAVGYATLPTHFFSLQGLQTRNIRASFHTQLEMQRVSWQLGFTYWILSTTELLDMIFSMPIIVYLYGVFGRSVKQYGMAYVIIACSFTGLVVLHILFFLLRRQFRYILWFVLYCLLSLPLFAVWFPILAVWQSNYAEYWYDVWPTVAGRGARLHGIIDQKSTKQQSPSKHEDDDNNDRDTEKNSTIAHHYSMQFLNDENDQVPRLRLGEYEIAEARRLHQAAEAALDSNFTGFTGFTGIDGQSPTDNIATPPIAQVRDGVHSTRITPNYRPSSLDMYGTNWKTRYPNSKLEDDMDSPNANPFADQNNPFEDPLSEQEPTRHRPSHSQSSYFTYASQPHTDFSTKLGLITDGSETMPSSMNSSGFAKMEHLPVDDLPAAHLPSNLELIDHHHQDEDDRASTLSISSNTFSIYSPEDTTTAAITAASSHPRHPLDHQQQDRMPRHRLVQNLAHPAFEGNPAPPLAALEEGRHRAVHNFTTIIQQPPSNLNLRQQYDSHANAPNTLLKARRLPHKKSHNHVLPMSSSSSLSHQYKKMNVDVSAAKIEAEVRSFLQRADLESTTKAQVKAHLVKHVRVDENDQTVMKYVNDCIEQVTTEMLNQLDDLRGYELY
jgi:hypothetical protein